EADDFRREDYRGDNLSALAKVPVQAGLSYYIAVDGKNGASGRVFLSFIFSSAPNDDWASSRSISGYGVFTGSNRGSSREAFEPVLSNVSRSSIWWEWTAPNTEGVYLNTKNSSISTY